MATFTKVNDWPEALVEVVNMGSDTFKIALSNTAPASESSNPTASGNGVIANVTQISYTNYSDDMTTDRTLESVTSAQTGGVYKFDASDIVIEASGGSLGPFRYIYVFDDTPTSPADPIVGLWDLGSSFTLSDGDSVTLQFAAAGIFTVT